MVDGKIEGQIPSMILRVAMVLRTEDDGPKGSSIAQPLLSQPSCAEVSHLPLLFSFGHDFQK